MKQASKGVRTKHLNRGPQMQDQEALVEEDEHPGHRRRCRPCLPFLAIGVAGTVAYFLVPPLAGNGLLFNVLGLTAAAGMVVGVRLMRPAQRLPWYLFAVAQVLFVTGDAFYYTYPKLTNQEVPFPSIGDAFYLAVYPLAITGILRLIHARNRRKDVASFIDALMIGTGAFLLSWVFLMAPYAHDTATSLTSKAFSIAYPLMDVLLLAVAARLAIGGGRREPSYYLLMAGIVALFVSDAIYGYITLNGSYETGSLLDVGWLVYYFLFGAAALHPSMRALSEPADDRPTRFTRSRFLLVTTAALMAPGVQIIQSVRGEPLDLPVVLSGAILLFVLAMVRMAGIIRRHESAEDRERALREAGEALVRATTTEATYTATLDAVRDLGGPGVVARLCLFEADGSFQVASATVAGCADRATARTVRDHLSPRRASPVPVDPALRAALALPGTHGHAVAAPLFSRDVLAGFLAVTSARELPQEVLDGIAALVSQATLAIDAIQASEEIHRARNEARFRSLVQHSSDVVAVMDADARITFLSPSAERVFGYDVDGLVGTSLLELVHREDRVRIAGLLSEVAANSSSKPRTIESRWRRCDGSWAFTESLVTNLQDDPTVCGVVLNTRDISERKAVEDELAHQAFHDSVTGLANRALFADRVQHALIRQRRHGGTAAVLFLDLDDFKVVNDSLGHAAGDRLLAEVAERLRTCLRKVDTAARLGGDEFALLVEDTNEEEIEHLAQRVLDGLRPPFVLDGKEVFVRASIGITLADPSESTVGTESLLRDADAAMYMAKALGKGRYQMFEPTMHEMVLRRLELNADLERAIENGEFVIHYQPVIGLADRRLAGLEALVRWNHPRRGMLLPAEFIAFAEETGLVIPLGRWVLEETCRKGRAIRDAFPSVPNLTMSVNLSARQLQHAEISAHVRQALERAGLDPRWLLLEITESVMMQDSAASAATLADLKQLGVRIAIDDFGTGYSSLTYIREFPIDILKVDRAFIDRMANSREDVALTAAIMGLADVLDLITVAEGIENEAQLEQLLSLGCAYGQGFFLAPPLDDVSLEAFLAAHVAGGSAVVPAA